MMTYEEVSMAIAKCEMAERDKDNAIAQYLMEQGWERHAREHDIDWWKHHWLEYPLHPETALAIARKWELGMEKGPV